MTKSKPVFLVALAVVSLTMVAGQANAQQCSTCGPAPAVSQDVFGYPASACSSCESTSCQGGCKAFGGRVFSGELKARHAHQQAINNKIAERNDVWPMPFGCADRQLYFSMWESMIDRGFEEQCLLTSVHFEEDGISLNKYGVQTVAGIMQGMPSQRRQVFIHKDIDQDMNDRRLASVENTIKTYYGQMGPARVSLSTGLPTSIRGTTAERIDAQWIEGMQAPIIPISSGEGVASSVSGG